MMRRTAVVLGFVLAMTGGGAVAAPVNGTCELTRLWQQTFSPVALPPFVVPLAGQQVGVTIDPDLGSFVVDGSTVPPLHFRNGFSDAWDVITLPRDPVAGTIDSAGNIVVPGFQFRVCTFGVCPGGGGDCDCVPGNLCSNDVSRLCLAGATSGELACDAPGVCQGVCSDDQTRSCATDDDCLPVGFCGRGSLLRLTADLTSGTATLDDRQMTGSAASAFVDGKITLVDLFRTSIETPVIGDTGVTSVTIDCTLDPIPDGTSLPPPPAWSVKKGTIKFGAGDPGAADDKLTLTGDFLPLAGVADFDTEDLLVTVGTEAETIVTVRIPAGSLAANKKGTKWKLVDKEGAVVEVSPPLLPGSEPSFKVGIKRKKETIYGLTLAAKNLDLDGLNAATEVATGIIFGFQTPSATVAATTKGTKLTF
jgi:hypothetical protein